MTNALVWLLYEALSIYWTILIVMAIMSWLLSFDVINYRNEFVRSIWTFLNAVTEPLLRPIRRLLPNLGGVDVSPIILILLIMFLQRLLGEYFPGFRY